jgi:hypothetical protein
MKAEFTPERVERWIKRRIMSRYRMDLPAARLAGQPQADSLLSDTALKLQQIETIIKYISPNENA